MIPRGLDQCAYKGIDVVRVDDDDVVESSFSVCNWVLVRAVPPLSVDNVFVLVHSGV